MPQRRQAIKAIREIRPIRIHEVGDADEAHVRAGNGRLVGGLSCDDGHATQPPIQFDGALCAVDAVHCHGINRACPGLELLRRQDLHPWEFAQQFALVNALRFLCYSLRCVENQVTTSVWLESAGGQQTLVRGTCFLGRSATSDIVLLDDKVSRRHAMVHLQGRDEFWLMDLGSSNGTYLNGRRVSQPSRLTDRDKIKVGDHTFTFRHPKTEPGSESTSVGAEKTVQEIKSLNCWLLLADIEASTQFIKRLPADEAPRMTGRWLADCKQIIDDSHGTINKFLGDGFLAYWVDSEKVPGSVARALAALKELQEQSAPRFRIALHHGKVFVGGAATLGEESLLGNEVNFVFRMEKLAGSIGTLRLISEPARAHLDSLLNTTEEGRHSVPSFDGEFLFYSF